jgi:hypothetical protein
MQNPKTIVLREATPRSRADYYQPPEPPVPSHHTAEYRSEKTMDEISEMRLEPHSHSFTFFKS